MISGITDGDAIPVLERMLQFSGHRQRLLADAVANLDTPGYRARDLDVDAFRAALDEAATDRRERHGGRGGDLDLASTRDVLVKKDRLELRPEEANANILFHDENDRDLDRTMQAVAENVLTFRTAATLIRDRFDLMLSAVRERP